MRPFEDIFAQLKHAVASKGYTHDVGSLWHETATHPHFYEKPAEHIAGSIEHAVNKHTGAGFTHPLTGEDVVNIIQDKSLTAFDHDAHVAKCNEQFQAMIGTRQSPIIPKPAEPAPRSDLLKKAEAQRAEDTILKGLKNRAREMSRKGIGGKWNAATPMARLEAGVMGFLALAGFVGSVNSASKIKEKNEDGESVISWNNVATTIVQGVGALICANLAYGALGRGRA